MVILFMLIIILIADLCVYEVWESQTEPLLDIRVADTDAKSDHVYAPHDVLCNAED